MTQIDSDWLNAPTTRTIFEILTDQGHQAFAVGGCVRDTLMGCPVGDIDFATEANPETVLKIAQEAGLKAIPTGIDHGTVTIVVDGTPFEVTTFRKDVQTDGRSAVVAFADSIETDSLRRDFTVNAMYVDAGGQVFDPQNGLPDCKTRQFRFVGDAQTRIREDALRILRFFRFNATHGSVEHGPDPDGLAACAADADLLDGLSAERITAEMSKLLAAPNPAPALATMEHAGILARILPGASSALAAPLVDLEQDRPPHWLRRLVTIGGNWDRLRLSKSQTKTIAAIQNALQSACPDIAQIAYRYGAQAAIDSTLIMGNPPNDEAALTGAAQNFPISARDLMPNLPAGPELGKALKTLEDQWVKSNFKLTKSELLKKTTP